MLSSNIRMMTLFPNYGTTFVRCDCFDRPGQCRPSCMQGHLGRKNVGMNHVSNVTLSRCLTPALSTKRSALLFKYPRSRLSLKRSALMCLRRSARLPLRRSVLLNMNSNVLTRMKKFAEMLTSKSVTLLMMRYVSLLLIQRLIMLPRTSVTWTMKKSALTGMSKFARLLRSL